MQDDFKGKLYVTLFFPPIRLPNVFVITSILETRLNKVHSILLTLK